MSSIQKTSSSVMQNTIVAKIWIWNTIKKYIKISLCYQETENICGRREGEGEGEEEGEEEER